jgi:oxalate decarboxylase/phosphoglucose isomerase-like protein (cupin superfamily)
MPDVSSRPPLEAGTFDRSEFAAELAAAPTNRNLGTSLSFENDDVRVFEIDLPPGSRGAFHVHERNYLWTVVDGGRGLQRFEDGTFAVRDYEVGDTRYLEHSPERRMIHDLENIGETRLRFVTVELLRQPSA